MTHHFIRQLQGRVRRRRVAVLLAWTLPVLVALGVVLADKVAPALAIAIAFVATLSIAAMIWRELRAVESRLIVRQLDAAVSPLEDSSDLLLHDNVQASGLRGLQRDRIIARLDPAKLPDLRPAWPWRRIAFGIALSVGVVVVNCFFPEHSVDTIGAPLATTPDKVVPVITQISDVRLEIEAPVYTHLPARIESALETQAAEGSQLRWQLQFNPAPSAASLHFHDGSVHPLVRQGEVWSATVQLKESTLYRIALEGGPPLADDRLYRLDAIIDQAPEIRVIEPDKTLSLLDAGQRSWLLDVEATDDYGIADAQLSITLAQGSGEQITVTERSVDLRPDTGANLRQRRYRHRLELAELGFAEGDDLIVRVTVRDIRKPKANATRSASYILRWPPDVAAESQGVDGLALKVLPAYFRSQRQIIIDSEALIAERVKLSPDEFLARSDTIGVDQKILRLRYGQFLGEEFESGVGARPEKVAEQAVDQKASTEDRAKAQQAALPSGHSADDGHDHSETKFGSADNVLAEYGHSHDHVDAATLLDPETKKILKAALAEMWQAELHLRLGEPVQALPFENRALGFIKQVQQSTRIYLARVGLELPPVDESRRLSGDRSGVRDRRGSLAATTPEDAQILATYQSLLLGESPDLDAFETWLGKRVPPLPDALSLVAAIDVLKRQPECTQCRESLLDRLWSVLPASPAATRVRSTPDEAGRLYLDNLSRIPQP